jgi:hypothetical protein
MCGLAEGGKTSTYCPGWQTCSSMGSTPRGFGDGRCEVGGRPGRGRLRPEAAVGVAAAAADPWRLCVVGVVLKRRGGQSGSSIRSMIARRVRNRVWSDVCVCRSQWTGAGRCVYCVAVRGGGFAGCCVRAWFACCFWGAFAEVLLADWVLQDWSPRGLMKDRKKPRA